MASTNVYELCAQTFHELICNAECKLFGSEEES